MTNQNEINNCLFFISACVAKHNVSYKKHSCYELKHMVEAFCKNYGVNDYYVSKNSFIEAMKQKGHERYKDGRFKITLRT